MVRILCRKWEMPTVFWFKNCCGKRFRCRLEDHFRIQTGKWVCGLYWAQVYGGLL